MDQDDTGRYREERRLSECLSYANLLLSIHHYIPSYLSAPSVYFLLDRRYFTNWTASLAALSQPGWVLGQFMYAPPGS
jgi:hypothetical protein